jgi:hypothetical protein
MSLSPATVNVIDQTPVSCGSQQVTTADSFEYCLADQSVELPLQFISARVAPLGDAAVLLLVSDLYGYHVMNSLGVLNRLSTAHLELSDACLSGFFFTYLPGVNKQVSFGPGDEEAVTSLLSREGAGRNLAPGGTVTAAQLIAAFNDGVMHAGHTCIRSP